GRTVTGVQTCAVPIYSFCSRILRENPVESGVDPLFSIMDEYESDELLKETISECIVKGIEKDEDIYKLVKEFNLDMLNRINETFMNIYKKIRNVGMSFDEISEMTLNNIDNFKIEEKQINFIKKNLSHLMDKARKNSKLYKLKEDPIWINFLNNHVYDETILEDLNYIEAKIGNMKGEEERIEKIKNVINNVMKIKEVKYRDNYKALIKLLIIIDEKFTAKKKRIGCLDYDDLQIYVLELLEQDHIRKRYQNKYRYIMVDEFQDTNELQKQILY